MSHALIQQIDTMLGRTPDTVITEPLYRATGPANVNGEVPGIGPPWVCENYGKPGHDYGTCRTCYSNYETNYLPNFTKGATP